MSARTAIVTPSPELRASPRTVRRCRGSRRPTPLRTRVVRGAIALAGLAAMVNGASWVLADAPKAANELVIAKSVLAFVAGAPSPTSACPSVDSHHDQGHSL